jgi:hypothetical protein
MPDRPHRTAEEDGRTLSVRGRRFVSFAVAALSISAAACAAKRPVLYPDARVESAGTAAAERDIDECIDLAKAHGTESSRAGEVATGTAGGAAVGGATGAVVGAIAGSAGRGAAAGAAGGATLGLFRGLFRSREPDPVFRGFVEQCLRERGYQPIGWR